ncbi:MAG: hypothetical protein E7313_08135 [Clostridiales bacterium]|nr:hypothetical protein [Clostridiales bacterium]
MEKINKIENDELLNEYLEVVKMDKLYEEKYCKIDAQEPMIREIYKSFRENLGIWKSVKNTNDIKKIINDNKGIELLKIEDLYIDEYSDLINKYVELDYLNLTKKQQEKIYSEEYMKILLNRESTADELKACIKILLKSKNVCKKIYECLKNK